MKTSIHLWLLVLPLLVQASVPKINDKVLQKNVNYGGLHPLLAIQQGHHRVLQEDRFEPLRIHLKLVDLNVQHFDSILGSPTNETRLQILIDEVIMPAKVFYEETVRVVRSKDPLHVPIDRCYSEFTNFESFDFFVPDADLAIRVVAQDAMGVPSAQICNEDQFGRPIFGRIDMTPTVLDGLDNEKNIATWRRIMMHEIAHLLGLSLTSMKNWYDLDTGLPRFPPELDKKTLDCQTFFSSTNDTVRMSADIGGSTNHWEIVTPTVLAVVKNQFNCSNRSFGARLEADLFSFGFSCPGSHWDSRWFQTELMSDGGPVTYRFLSLLTMAVIEDTGWYLVNYTNLEPPSFGRGASCDFLFEPCIVNGSVPAYSDQTFCDFDNFAGCTNDNERIGICRIRNLTASNSYCVPIPTPEEQYFGSEEIGGIHGPSTDYCPVFQGSSSIVNGVHTLDCTDPDGNITASSFELHGPGGRCVESSVQSLVEFEEEYCKETFACPTYPFEFTIPLCMDVKCNPELEAVEIKFGDQSILCEFDGQLIDIPDVPGHTIKCPRIAIICKEYFCPKNCAGRGLCDYSKRLPTCLCNDPQDPSPFCANSPRFKTGELLEVTAPSTSESPSETPSKAPSMVPSAVSSEKPSIITSQDSATSKTRFTIFLLTTFSALLFL